MLLTEEPVWQEIRRYRDKWHALRLADLFTADPDRRANFTVHVEGLSADFSRNHLTETTLGLFERLAEARSLAARRDDMMRGAPINNTEKRAVLHTALRAPEGAAPIFVDGVNVLGEIAAVQERIKAFVEEVRSGRWLGASGQPIRAVVNIGIGGSDLGPRLAVSALRDYSDKLDVRFIANIDPAERKAVLAGLDPATTLFLIVSKTFSTQETLANAQAARAWIVEALGAEAPARHFVAVSTHAEAVTAFGIDTDHMFPMWDWVGGRYSVWSAVGLSVALAIGWEAFKAFLAGAAAMDAHFCTAPWRHNMPFLLGMTGLWYRNFWGSGAHAILPYTEKMRDLPRFLQQLEMESNGKSVLQDGAPSPVPTAPVIFGECGTVGQHSFHQWLHQGTDVTPADFIGVRKADAFDPEAHRALLANMLAQSDALLYGSKDPNPARVNPGNKPSTLIWLETLDPATLGALLALYEHKVFVQGVIWGINSFDQFGVELGKKLAKAALAAQG